MSTPNPFAGLKNTRTDYEALAKKLAANSDKKDYSDDRFYYPTRDAEGNGYALIRFLPSKDPNGAPYVETFSHRFKGPGGWFIDNCRTTIGEKCPVCDINSTLVNEHGGDWKKVPEWVAKEVRSKKRLKQFITNIYVIADPKNKENEGKVFLFKMGKQIVDKILSAMQPKFPGDPQFDAYNPWQGANFALKIRKVEGQTNYTASTWNQPSPLFDDDNAIMGLADQLYDLGEFTNPDEYNSYEDQEKRLNKVLGSRTHQAAGESSAPSNSGAKQDPAPEPASRNWTAPTAAPTDSEDDDVGELFDDVDF